MEETIVFFSRNGMAYGVKEEEKKNWWEEKEKKALVFVRKRWSEVVFYLVGCKWWIDGKFPFNEMERSFKENLVG